MDFSKIWLHDRWYGQEARERLRQLALWSKKPILMYQNCGIPFGAEIEIEKEIKLFQEEGIIAFWKYENEASYEESLSTFSSLPATIIDDSTYRKVLRFVDHRLEEIPPKEDILGFSQEGMLLEQVVLRRRFFSQALSGALHVDALADSGNYSDLYAPSYTLLKVSDILDQFFSAINVPRLHLLETESFLEFRQNSQEILFEIVEEIYREIAGSEEDPTTHSEIVSRLMSKYESEFLDFLKTQPSSDSQNSYDAYKSGSVTEIESQLARFSLAESLSDFQDWFYVDDKGYSRLALMLIDWKSKS